MRWPSRDKPELHQRGKWWVVRWYSPIEKRCRAIRTRSETYARAMHALLTVSDKETP